MGDRRICDYPGEIDEQLAEVGIDNPRGPSSCRSVSARSQRRWRVHYRATNSDALLVGVEPVDAACVMESICAGRLVSSTVSSDSIMAGLNCGTPSPIGWPTVSAAFDVFVTVSDDEDVDAMRQFNRNGIFSGESGAAPLAGLAALAQGRGDLYDRLTQRNVLLLSTEGVTDPGYYVKHVGPLPG